MNKKLKAIVCVDENWGIGTDNQLLFHIKGDMQHFREMTHDRTVIMGRNTMMSLPHPDKGLANRNCIVLSHKDDGINKDVYQIAHNEDKLWELLKTIPGYRDPVVIGGSMVYKMLMPYCHIIHVTKVFESRPDADCFFPDLDNDNRWKITYQSDIKTETMRHDKHIRYQICTYTRQPGTSKYAEIRTNFTDTQQNITYVDAWFTPDDSEEGIVIAKIHLDTKEIEYVDTDAATDPYAQECIKAVLNDI